MIGSIRVTNNLNRLAVFTHDLSISDLNQQVIGHTLRVIRDTLGVMLAGATLSEIRGLAEKASILGGPGRSTRSEERRVGKECSC